MQVKKRTNRISALKELLSYYQDITETITEPFIILDKKLCVVTANQAFYRKFKVLNKDTENISVYKLGNSQRNTPELRDLLENILPKHRILSNFEVTHNYPGIGQKTMLLNARQVDSKQLILLAIKDVTQVIKLRADSAKLTAGLLQQHAKLQALSDAKDEFIMMASHQLRTPATAVKQYVGMLVEGYGGKMPKKQVAMLNLAYESNEREIDIIEDLLRVAQVDEGKVYLLKTNYGVAVQIEAIIDDQFSTIKKRGQSVIFNKPAKLITICADKKLMRMVIENLLDNASKYSFDNHQITINLKQKDGFTFISVKDKGVGVSKKDMTKLFKRFSRIENALSVSVTGTGLGLYWVKKIMDLHSGTVEVMSKLNNGSTFTLKIPSLKIDSATPPKLHAAM